MIMQFHTPHKKNSTLVTQLVCAVLFCAFSFLWLFCFQADVIAVAQHVLSGGVTHYDRTVGALLITLVLQILQRVVATLTRLYRRTHAVTYLPSMLVLAVISDINADIDSHFSLGAWYWCYGELSSGWQGRCCPSILRRSLRDSSLVAYGSTCC